MPEAGEPLSPRELEVLEEMARGASNREIADRLVISPNTVKVHVRNVAVKLEAASRTEAVTRALQQGVITLSGGSVVPGLVAQEEEEEAQAVLPESVVSADIAPLDEEAVSADLPPAEPARSGSKRPVWLMVAAFVALALLMAGGYQWWQSRVTPVPAVATAPPPFQPTPMAEAGWAHWLPLPAGRTAMAVASVGLNLYVVGGETEAGVTGSTLVYSGDQAAWRERAEKPTPVRDAAVAVLAEQLYVAGGRRQDGSLTAVLEAYSPGSDAWRVAAALPRPMAGAVLLADGGYLYLIGGEVADGVSADVWRYDPASDGWLPLASLQQPRALAAAGTLNNTLYVMGGQAGGETLVSCERLVSAETVWESCPDLLTPRSGAAAATLFNKLYLVGGSSEGVAWGEQFDPNSAGWQLVTLPMLSGGARWDQPGLAVIETRLYLLGGTLEGSLQTGTWIYEPFPYQFYFPSTSFGGD
jgi:DNA-binding CsgD family transcriptional regulator/N-acetylneuraminic acid mutarotase